MSVPATKLPHKHRLTKLAEELVSIAREMRQYGVFSIDMLETSGGTKHYKAMMRPNDLDQFPGETIKVSDFDLESVKLSVNAGGMEFFALNKRK